MAHKELAFPYFLQIAQRSLSWQERSVVARLLENLAPPYQQQLHELTVVGRCGCGACPTVFFQPHQIGDAERNLASYAGKDISGGLVGAVLLEKQGVLSQLEFYSVDGHEPWHVPEASSLEPFH